MPNHKLGPGQRTAPPNSRLNSESKDGAGRAPAPSLLSESGRNKRRGLRWVMRTWLGQTERGSTWESWREKRVNLRRMGRISMPEGRTMPRPSDMAQPQDEPTIEDEGLAAEKQNDLMLMQGHEPTSADVLQCALAAGSPRWGAWHRRIPSCRAVYRGGIGTRI